MGGVFGWKNYFMTDVKILFDIRHKLSSAPYANHESLWVQTMSAGARNGQFLTVVREIKSQAESTDRVNLELCLGAKLLEDILAIEL